MSYDTAFTALLAAGWPEADAAELAQITIDLQAKDEEAARGRHEKPGGNRVCILVRLT